MLSDIAIIDLKLATLSNIYFGTLTYHIDFQVSDPIYNLEPTHKYNIQRRTTNLKISYYVKDSFSADFTGSLKKLEREVEDVYIQRLRDACFRERAYKVREPIPTIYVKQTFQRRNKS